MVVLLLLAILITLLGAWEALWGLALWLLALALAAGLAAWLISALSEYGAVAVLSQLTFFGIAGVIIASAYIAISEAAANRR